MIEVDQLSKRYGSFLAVDRLCLTVGKGEIVGLLGPNGAGKTTTMRMLTTYVTPTSGRASLAGHDVRDESLAVRRNVGYLPENVPLYPEMRVSEYLDFRGRLKDLSRARRRQAIAECISRCGLANVERRIVGQLSKGYRQRVGLAEAMLHDPPILILDEPTAGLDPIQIREIRTLIRELGVRHTILLSTHIMSEVEAVCGRVVIIAQGKIALDDRLDRLKAEQAIVLEAHGPVDSIRNALLAMPGVEKAVPISRNQEYASFEVSTREGMDLRESIGRELMTNGWPLRHLALRRSTLEDRFVEAVSRTALADVNSPNAPHGSSRG